MERERTRNGFDCGFPGFQTGLVRVLYETCSELIVFQSELVRYLCETCMEPKG
ncbi:hypothetical protein FH588_22095 [Leptospira interrogans]|uniref:hypothetical protein n=1 Tax=Leptospira interrogans TaxID=173 RepID=UPI001F4CE48B|nr:hypothetical protein [Leptospira interrogans]UNE67096.1 hypothetical protein FH588_21840 [Leptospira interrogans]UNE67141.1 hypothetical protein FH588_22095 [Leptospira interrogans]